VDDFTHFKAYLNDLWTNLAMMDYPYPTSFLMPLPGKPVNTACELINMRLNASNETDHFKLIIDGISAGVDMYTNYTGRYLDENAVFVIFL